MYRMLDSQLEKLKKKIQREFNHMGTIGFDELNIVGVKKLTQEMYDRLVAENEKAYLKIAEEAYKRAKKSVKADDAEETEIGAEWVAGILAMFNLVTGYLYGKEVDRKRMRLNEQILTAREYDSRTAYNECLRRSANLWYTQSMQYGIDMVDKARIQAFKDAGIKRVRWISVHDDKRCDECKHRDGKIYDIDKVPVKNHYGCRCYLEPVKEDEEQ